MLGHDVPATESKNATDTLPDKITISGGRTSCPATESKNAVDTLPNTTKTSAGETSCPDVSTIGWQSGFYDERIRDGRQSSTAMEYVHANAYKHQLVTTPLDWPWTSIHFSLLIDPMELWLD